MYKKDITSIRKFILDALIKVYPEKSIVDSNLILLHQGQFANATVFEYKSKDFSITIKDFSGSPWFIKKTLGKLFINLEANTIKALKDNNSVTKNIKRLSPYTICFDFIEGEPLKISNEKDIPKEFFLELEKNVEKMHEQNIVHLDLRNLGNIILGKDGYPYIIDFQSAISTRFLTKWLDKTLKLSNLTGVYKCWKNRCNEPLDEKREKILEDFQKIRKIWVFKGYPITRTVKNLKKLLQKRA